MAYACFSKPFGAGSFSSRQCSAWSPERSVPDTDGSKTSKALIIDLDSDTLPMPPGSWSMFNRPLGWSFFWIYFLCTKVALQVKSTWQEIHCQATPNQNVIVDAVRGSWLILDLLTLTWFRNQNQDSPFILLHNHKCLSKSLLCLWGGRISRCVSVYESYIKLNWIHAMPIGF